MGPLWLINAILPGMQKRGNGKIVLVSSVGGGISQFPGMSRHCEYVILIMLSVHIGSASAADWCFAETQQLSLTVFRLCQPHITHFPCKEFYC